MMMGMMTHETKMKMAQTFSQAHRPMNFIGNVNVPFKIPAMMAKLIPRNKTDVTLIDTLSELQDGRSPEVRP